MSTEANAGRTPDIDAGDPGRTAPPPVDVTARQPVVDAAVQPAENATPAPEAKVEAAPTVVTEPAVITSGPSQKQKVLSDAKEALSSIAGGLGSLIGALFGLILSLCPFLKRSSVRNALAAAAWIAAFVLFWIGFGFWTAIIGTPLLYGVTRFQLWTPPAEPQA